jgi:hypothetical protein
MHGSSKHDEADIDARTERLVVLQVAGRRRGRERERMYRALRNIDRNHVDDAIGSLTLAGVVAVKGQSVHQTAALRRVDCLGMIAV